MVRWSKTRTSPQLAQLVRLETFILSPRFSLTNQIVNPLTVTLSATLGILGTSAINFKWGLQLWYVHQPSMFVKAEQEIQEYMGSPGSNLGPSLVCRKPLCCSSVRILLALLLPGRQRSSQYAAFRLGCYYACSPFHDNSSWELYLCHPRIRHRAMENPLISTSFHLFLGWLWNFHGMNMLLLSPVASTE
jgi:hypothetical protein